MAAPCATCARGSLLACDLLGPYACPTQPSIVVTVLVTDSLTGAPAAWRATGRLVSATFADTLRHIPASDTTQALMLHYPGDRRGIFIVSVEKPGYRTWVSASFRPRADECGVSGPTLAARLQAE